VLVVLDSNIWLSELGLKSAMGATARLFMSRRNAVLVLPEVIELEVTQHIRSELVESCETLRDSHRRLLGLFGKLRELVLPTEQDIEFKCGALFDNLGIEIRRVPFSIESARSSFLKTILKTPPSDKTQQFKDGVIWADCMALMMDDDVSLVTGDKAFYEGKELSKGLAKSLFRESQAMPFGISLFPTLSALVDELRIEIDIPKKLLLEIILHKTSSSVAKILLRSGFSEAGEEATVDTKVFVTERPDSLAVEFSVSMPIKDVRGEGRVEASLTIMGECTFLQGSRGFSDIRLHQEGVSFNSADGIRSGSSHAYGYINASFGDRDVQHTVRHAI